MIVFLIEILTICNEENGYLPLKFVIIFLCKYFIFFFTIEYQTPTI